MEETNLSSWDGLVNNYLKADDFEGLTGDFAVIDVKLNENQSDGKKRLDLIILKNGNNAIVPCNFTNSKFLKSKVTSPEELRNKTIVWEKVRVRNPTTGQQVNSLSFIEVK